MVLDRLAHQRLPPLTGSGTARRRHAVGLLERRPVLRSSRRRACPHLSTQLLRGRSASRRPAAASPSETCVRMRGVPLVPAPAQVGRHVRWRCGRSTRRRGGAERSRSRFGRILRLARRRRAGTGSSPRTASPARSRGRRTGATPVSRARQVGRGERRDRVRAAAAEHAELLAVGVARAALARDAAEAVGGLLVDLRRRRVAVAVAGIGSVLLQGMTTLLKQEDERRGSAPGTGSVSLAERGQVRDRRAAGP